MIIKLFINLILFTCILIAKIYNIFLTSVFSQKYIYLRLIRDNALHVNLYYWQILLLQGTIRGCKESQRKQGKATAREREYQVSAADLQTTLNFRAANQTESGNTTTIKPPGNTTHHHHHHHHHQYPYFSGYYGGHPQNIHHVEITTTQPYSQNGYHVPYEQPANFYHDDKYNVYPGLNPSYSAPYSPDPTHEYADFNRQYPSGYQPPNISDGFKPLK